MFKYRKRILIVLVCATLGLVALWFGLSRSSSGEIQVAFVRVSQQENYMVVFAITNNFEFPIECIQWRVVKNSHGSEGWPERQTGGPFPRCNVSPNNFATFEIPRCETNEWRVHVSYWDARVTPLDRYRNRFAEFAFREGWHRLSTSVQRNKIHGEVAGPVMLGSSPVLQVQVPK
jgi:hypothetical protein